MGLKRETLERQLATAKDALESYSSALSGKGLDEKAQRRNAKWRNLNATCRQIRNRLKSVSATEAINAEVEERKAQRDSGESESADEA